MLSEHIIASIHTPAKITTSSKDVGIFLYEVQPLTGMRQAFKRSATATNCLAVSDTHIFASQSEKAVIHAYSRAKGNHEATIPFNEKVTSLALAASSSILIMGTESGRVMLWEQATGRLISASQSHLQAVTCIVVEPASQFFLSGSKDSTVLVWSLPSILSFVNVNSNAQIDPRSPVQSLSDHRGPVTALAIGHSHTQSNLAITGSEDQSAIIWDYRRGLALRTYLLKSVPQALIFDICDRGFYTTYSNGDVQLVDFYNGQGSKNALYDEDDDTAYQPNDLHLWSAFGEEIGEGLCLAMSWDGSRLLSGHKSGKIVAWDVGKETFIEVIDILAGPVTNLVTLPPYGFVEKAQYPFKLAELVKPRLSTTENVGTVPGDYTFTMTPNQSVETSRFMASESALGDRSPFTEALLHPSFPSHLLEAGLTELAGGGSTIVKATNGHLENSETDVESDRKLQELEDLKAQNKRLIEQNEHLRKLQKVSFDQIREKTQFVTSLIDEQRHLAEIAKKEHGWDIKDMNIEWSSFQQRSRAQMEQKPASKVSQKTSNSSEKRSSRASSRSKSQVDEDSPMVDVEP